MTHEPVNRGVIFDMDGVLLRTDEYHYRSWLELAIAYRIPFTREVFDRRMRGRERPAALAVFLEAVKESFPAQRQATIAAEKQQRFLEIVRREGVAPLPGVVPLLHELKASGAKLGVGSSSRNTRPLLEAARLCSYFDAIVDTHDYPGKPEPDIFLAAAARLPAPPQQCVVVEDALDGIEAARRAGMAVLAVGPRERFDDQVHWAPTLEGVKASWLLSLK
jgi:beta-phosphoglucomutase